MKLTAQHLLSRNTSEAIADKDNHARRRCGGPSYMPFATRSTAGSRKGSGPPGRRREARSIGGRRDDSGDVAAREDQARGERPKTVRPITGETRRAGVCRPGSGKGVQVDDMLIVVVSDTSDSTQRSQKRSLEWHCVGVSDFTITSFS